MIDQRYDSQLAAWAIDRAVELSKQNPTGLRDVKQITDYAAAFCNWMANAAVEVVPSLTQTELDELAEHEKHLRGEGIPANNVEPDTEVKGNA